MDELKDAIVQLIGRYQHLQMTYSALRSERAQGAASTYAIVVDDLRAAIGMEDHQHVIWLAGANPPHYEIRGTGAIYDGPRRDPNG